jgi:outer membrane receptor protein involved in Fe transport
MQRGWGEGARWARCAVGLWFMCTNAAIAQPAPTAQPKGRGAIIVKVVTEGDGAPLKGATIETVGEPHVTATTGPDGKGRLDVPPGTYSVKASAEQFSPVTIHKLNVAVGKAVGSTAKLRAKEEPTTQSKQTVEVTGVVKEASEATQLQQRKEATTVGDSVGHEAIAKTTDSSAAEVVTRAPSVTTRDNKYIIVRGLTERYSGAMLNGSRLPSTDPNRRIVPLDIFPADFIEALTIIKTYSPDLPGDFAGGLVDIKLAKPPKEFEWSVNTSMSFNTETTFRKYDTYQGYPDDWLTFGDNPRQLPSTFDIFPANPNPQPPFNPTTTQMRSLVASLADNWNVDSATAPPNFNFDGSIGNTWGPFGIALAGVYGWKFSVHRDQVNNAFKSPSELESGVGENFTYDVSDFTTELGALLSSQYEIDPDQRILARALVNRQGINEVQNGQGSDVSLSALDQFPTSSEYTANQLGFGALEGIHHFSWIDLDWRGSWAPSSQEVPDAKYYNYNKLDTEPPGTPQRLEVVRSALQPERIWTSLSEFLQDYYVDGIVPFRALPLVDGWRALDGKVKFGVNYALRDRAFLYQVFRVSSQDAQRLNLALPPDSLLVPRNFSVNGPLKFNRFSYEPFDANQEIAAFYGMVDTPIIRDRLRLIGGARLEYSFIKTDGFEQAVGPVKSVINDLNPLPAVSLVYTPRDDMNVRAAFSQTVSRPEFRELTPVFFTTLPGERSLRGNPNLVTANITNWDLRWEWFFTPLELASVGFFYKNFKEPIELVTGTDAGGNVSDVYVNYDSATLWGFELEARKNFDFAASWAREISWLAPIAPHLADVQLLINVSTNESATSEGFTPPPLSIAKVSPAPGEKALVSAPPYVVNAALEYDNTKWGIFRLLYNTIGPAIVAKGTLFSDGQPLDDIMTVRRDQLDFVWLSDVTLFNTPFSTKFGVENILNDAFEETQGPRTTNRYRTGVTFSTGIQYSF